MFSREYKVRSNNQIKTSDKKALLKDVLKYYPTIDETKLKELISVKDSEISTSKIQTHDSVDLLVYIVDKCPLFFKQEKQDELIPTVYFLWKFPDLLPKFFTHKEVFGKLLNGADLMLPGVITDGPVNLYTFKQIKKNELCSICIDRNGAPIGVGRTLLSGEDMYMSAMRGRCLTVLQMYQDNLWQSGNRSLNVPQIEMKKPEITTNEENEISTAATATTSKNNNELNQESSLAAESIQQKQPESEKAEKNERLEEKEPNAAVAAAADFVTEKISQMKAAGSDRDETSPPINHEQLLYDSFMLTIKYKSKDIKLPIIVSTFMKLMQTNIQTDIEQKHFDLNKTKYKKMSNFLKEMELNGIIKLKEAQKGVLSISSINKESEAFKIYIKPDWFREMEASATTAKVSAAAEAAVSANLDELLMNSATYEVNEMYKIDANCEELLKPKYKKGNVVSSSEIRSYLINNYIKEKQLNIPERPKFVKLDYALNRIVYNSKKQITLPNGDLNESECYVTYEDLFATLFGKLNHMHQLKRMSAPISASNRVQLIQSQLRKGKFQPIEFKLESRGGNKKMTAIYHLTQFMIDVEIIKNKIRRLLGCSVTINELTATSSVEVTTTKLIATAVADNNQDVISSTSSSVSVNEQAFIIYVQGNQIYQVSDLLKTEFGIPLKYMIGLELGVKQ